MQTSSVYFDLYRNMVANVDYVNRIKKHMGSVAQAEKEGKVDEMTFHVSEMLRLCEYNPGVLVPYFFPNFADNKPMTLWTRPHAFSMLSFTPNGNLTTCASRQIGKCCAFNTNVLCSGNGGIDSHEESLEHLFNTARAAADR